jgi:hypothetical protein
MVPSRRRLVWLIGALVPACVSVATPPVTEAQANIPLDAPEMFDSALVVPVGYFATWTTSDRGDTQVQLAVDPMRTNGGVLSLPDLAHLRTMLATAARGTSPVTATH